MNDILKQLEEDARRIRVARTLPKGPLKPDLMYQVIEDFEAIRKEHQLSYVQVAKEMGISTSMLSTVKHAHEGEWVGDLEKLVRQINSWLEQHMRRRTAPMPGGFIETRAAKDMLTVARQAIATNTIGLIYGPSGVGKTMALQALQATYAGSMLIRVRQSARTPAGIAKRLTAQLRINRPGRTLFDMQDAITRHLEGSNRLLMVDEAHQVIRTGLEFLRDIHDETGIPMLFAGTREIDDKVSDFSEWAGQLNRRVGLRADIVARVGGPGGGGKGEQPLFTVEEIVQIFQSDQVRFTADGAMLMTRLANVIGHGCLGLCDKVVRIAAMTREAKTAVRNGNGIDARLLLAVVREMNGELVASELDKAMADLPEIKVKAG